MKFSFNQSINNKIIIFTSAFGIIILAIIIFVIYPLFTNLTTLNTELYDNRVQLAIYEKQRLNLDETRQEYNNIKSDIDNITSVLINKEDLLEFIDTMDTISEKNNLTQNINLSNLDQALDSQDLEMTVGINGSWDNISNYIYTLENLNYYLLIDNPFFTKNDDNSITMEFNLAVYLQ